MKKSTLMENKKLKPTLLLLKTEKKLKIFWKEKMLKELRLPSRELPALPKALTKPRKSNPPKKALKNLRMPLMLKTSNLSSKKKKKPLLMKEPLSKIPKNN